MPGLAFMLPALALFAVFVVYPIGFNIQASTLKWDGVNPGTFVGAQNYFDLFRDPVFFITLRNSGYWVVLTIIPQAAIGFLLALALNKGVFASTAYRALFFIPTILSPVVVGIVWQQIMNPSNGVIASVGRATGLDWLARDWLGNPSTAIFAVIFVNVWMWTGFSMLYYLAGLQLVDTSVLEAAKIDGANGFQRTLRITLPLLKSTHLSLLLLGVIGSLKTFGLVYVLTLGGPNHASETLPTYLFDQAFQLQSVGYAATITVVLIVIAVGASLSMMRIVGAGYLTGVEK